MRMAHNPGEYFWQCQACEFHMLMKKTSTALAKNVLGPKIREIRLRTTPPVSQEDLCARLEILRPRLGSALKI
jgi:hypothetical protein